MMRVPDYRKLILVNAVMVPKSDRHLFLGCPSQFVIQQPAIDTRI